MAKTAKTPKTPKPATQVVPGEAGQKTLVTFLLDRSGSMQGLQKMAIDSFNGLVSELRASAADIRLSLVLFDTGSDGAMDLQKVWVGERVSKVGALTPDLYSPRGMTPLCDALAHTIQAVSDSLKGRVAKVVIAVQTGGLENASREHSWESVRALIAQKQADGWEFKFLGAGLESGAYQQAAHLGLRKGTTVSYDKTNPIASEAAFVATGANIRAFAEGAALSPDYSSAQKLASGDDEDDAPAPGPGDARFSGIGLIPDYMLRGGLTGVPVPGPSVGLPHGWGGAGTGVAPASVGITTRGLGFDALLAQAGTPNPALAPRVVEPFTLDAFGEKGEA